jgi:hypothetical protein
LNEQRTGKDIEGRGIFPEGLRKTTENLPGFRAEI